MALRIIGWVTTGLLVGIPLVGSLVASTPIVGTYKFAFLFLVPLLWTPWWMRRLLDLRPLPYAIYASAMVLHDLGAFGAYRMEFFGLSFDTYVHFYFGVAAGFLLAHAFRARLGLRGVGLWIGTLIFILGIGGIHELIELASTLWLGPEKGMLKVLADDPYDTQKDLFNNLAGALVAVILRSFIPALRAGEREEAAPEQTPLTKP